jgi:hypothetical protein
VKGLCNALALMAQASHRRAPSHFGETDLCENLASDAEYDCRLLVWPSPG